MGKEKKYSFILKILDKVFAFLSKARCACCNSTCIVGDEASHSMESRPTSPDTNSTERTTMGELM